MSAPAAAVPITVVIAARDERDNIADCIASVSWSAEVIVSESGSTDDTADIARTAGARVVQGPASTIGGQRNRAIAAAANDWILVVDADERGTPELGVELGRLPGASGAREAYRVPRRNIFLGKEIKGGGWQSDAPVRFFRSHLRYDDSRVHERVVTATEPGMVAAALRHVPYRSLAHWAAKLDRYSDHWARDKFERGRRATAWSVLARPPAKFLTAYVLRGGWRDGAHGVVLAATAAVSVAVKYARLWELSQRR